MPDPEKEAPAYHARAPRSTATVAAGAGSRRGSERAWIALGANLGAPATTLRRALRWLAALPEVAIEARSTLHRTAAVPWPEAREEVPQPDYLNAVVRVATRHDPLALLRVLLSLERAAGRERSRKWGPRTLDLDLLMMGRRGELVVREPELELPHPRMLTRRFVLAPLAEIDPQLVLASGLTVHQQLARL